MTCQNSIKRYAHTIESFVYDEHGTQNHKISIDWSLFMSELTMLTDPIYYREAIRFNEDVYLQW